MENIYYKRANYLKNKYKSKDPEEIAEEEGIKIYYRDDFNKLLGMYAVVLGRRCIFVKKDISQAKKRLVIAHELGHDQFHREFAMEKGLKSFIITDMTNRAEYEANIFASHLLIDNDDILNYAMEGYDIVQISQLLDVNINLCLIKINEMIKLGYNFYSFKQPNSNFLKDV